MNILIWLGPACSLQYIITVKLEVSIFPSLVVSIWVLGIWNLPLLTLVMNEFWCGTTWAGECAWKQQKGHHTGFSWQFKIPPNLMVAVWPWRVRWTRDYSDSLRHIPGTDKTRVHTGNKSQWYWYSPICRTGDITRVWTGDKMIGSGGARSYPPLTDLLTSWTK